MTAALHNDRYDLGAARQARDAAIERARLNADGSWKDRALAAVYATAEQLDEFTTADVWEGGLEKPREPRAMGAVMQLAARLGYCKATDRYRPTSNVSQHYQPIRVYESLVRGG